MKALNLIRFFTPSIGVLGLTMIISAANGQEVDDLYFTKADRKTVKAEKIVDVASQTTNTSSVDSKNITKTTEEYSSKNINPEYIARYKNTEANEVTEPALKDNSEYSSKDYFVENYDNSEYVSDPNRTEIDYAALNKRDQMSTSNYNNYSNYNRPYSSPSWRFSPYMSMGYGSAYGYNPYMMGYDPYMMGYGSGLSMGMGFGSGFGYGSAMSYSIGMSWGTGYNPWGGWGGYPGYYSPYGRGGFNDPWGSSFGYNPYRYGGFGSPYGNYCYGGFSPTVFATASTNGSEYVNGRNISYKSRTTRSTTTPNYTRTSAADKVRVSSGNESVRRPSRTVSTSNAVSNGRTSRDYSKISNEKYYNTARRSNVSNSTQRISTSSSSRDAYRRSTTGSTSRYNTSTINNNKPSRSSGYNSGYNRSSTNTRSTSYSGRSGSSGSSYSPSRSSSGSSSYSGRSFSTGGSSSRSSSSYSSGSSGSSSAGRSSGGASRSGGRQ